jgi:ABC-type transport system involved in multi-copper enzyme maturation permease subunit
VKATLKAAGLIARFDIATSLRNGRSLAAVALYGVGAALTAAFLSWAEAQASVLGDQAHVNINGKGLREALLAILQQKGGADTELVRHVLSIPMAATVFFYLTLTFLPFLVAFTSHDVINGEVRTHSSRFLLFRCSRASLLLGKLLSHLALLAAVTAVSNLVLFGLAGARLADFPAGATAARLAVFWVYSVLYGACYLCLSALVSALIDSGIVSLLTLLAVLVGSWVVSFSEAIGFLSPSAWRLGLFSASPAVVAHSLLAYAAFGAVFLGLAWARVDRRDL